MIITNYRNFAPKKEKTVKMPQISVRGLEMPESPIRKLAPLAAAAKKRGTKVYHLNIGQPDLPTPKVALDAIKNVDREILEYSPSQGYLGYREKLVSYYANTTSMSAPMILLLPTVVQKLCSSLFCHA